MRTATLPTNGAFAKQPGTPTATEKQFALPGIHCAGCIGKIERALNSRAGVTNARVNLSLKRLTVVGTIASDRVIEVLSDIGFDANPLDKSILNNTAGDKEHSLLLRVAVSGFAMMNVMLLSVAVWSGATDATRDLFHLISAMIAIPAVSFAAQPFFGNAWRALRAGKMNMDVPISLAILLALGMSLFESLQGGEHAYFDAAISLTFFLLIGRYLDQQTRRTARSAAQELSALEAHTAQLYQDGSVTSVLVTDLRIGDTVLVATGARIAIDGTLDSARTSLDRSFLTGESDSVAMQRGAPVQAGEINIGAPIRVIATAVGEDTSLRRMATLVELAENGRNSYTALADRAAQIYAPLVHVLAFVAFIGWFWFSGDARYAINIAIAVLIITCPCALGLAVPAVSTAAIGRLFSKGYLVKHATALERLAEVDRVVFDKTGTLTVPGVALDAGLTETEKSVALALAQNSDHPVSRAVVQALPFVKPATVSQVVEVAGCGVEGQFEGQGVRLGNGHWLGADFDGMGLQIGTVKTAINISETLRNGVSEALEDLVIPTEIMTGDTTAKAEVIARALGIKNYHAAVSAVEKHSILQAYADNNEHVLMVGDGLNDTAALAAAHASIAPSSALDASRSAADIVVLNDSFADLPFVLRLAKSARLLSQQNFAIAAIYNMIAVPIALAGFASPLLAAIAMSTSSITVLLNAQRIRQIK